MPGIGVISNANARLNRLSPGIKDRLTFMVGRGGEVASTGTLDDAQSAVRAFKECEIDVVAISGGDGTAHRTLELLLAEYGDEEVPPILLLPTGTMNMVPSSFGISGNSMSTMLEVLARYRHNLPLRCVRRNLLRVNDHHAFMFGLGLATRFLSSYYDEGATPVGAMKLLSRIVFGAFKGEAEMLQSWMRPMGMRYQLDDGPERRSEGYMLFCSFVEEVALRFRIFPRAGFDRNVFEIMRVATPPWTLARSLPQLWMGSSRPIEGMERGMARSFELHLDEPEPYTLDGEIYEPEDAFVVTPGPELRFVTTGMGRPGAGSRVRLEQVGPWGMRYFI